MMEEGGGFWTEGELLAKVKCCLRNWGLEHKVPTQP